MKTKLRKLGNSQAAIIPSKLLKEAGMDKESEVTITVRQGAVVITPVRKSFYGILPQKEAESLRRQTKAMREEWGQ